MRKAQAAAFASATIVLALATRAVMAATKAELPNKEFKAGRDN